MTRVTRVHYDEAAAAPVVVARRPQRTLNEAVARPPVEPSCVSEIT